VEPHEEYVRVGYHGEREFQASGHLPRQGSAGYGGYSGGYEVSGGYGADGGSFSGQNRHRRGPPIYDIGLQDYTQGEEASDGKRTGRYSAATHQKPASGNNNLYNNVPGRAAVGATPRPGYKKQQFHEQPDLVQDYAIRGPQAYYDPGPLGEEGGAVGGEGGGHGHPDEYGSHGGGNNFEEYERLVEEGHKSSIHDGEEGNDGDGSGGEFNNHGLDAEDVHGVEVAAAAAVEEQIENDPRYNNDGFEQDNDDDDRHLDESSSSGSGGGEGEENRHQNEDLFDPANFPFQGYGDHHQQQGGGGGEGQDDDGFGHRPPGGDHDSASGGGGGHFGSQGYQSEDATSYGSKPPGEFGGGKPLYEEGGFHPSAQPPSGSYPRQESPPPPPPRYQEPQQGGQQSPPDADYERYFTLHYDYDYEPANNNNGNDHNSSPAAAASQEERGDDRQHGGGVDEHGFEDIFADKRSVRGQGSRGFGHF
jgi:hypothetical protein